MSVGLRRPLGVVLACAAAAAARSTFSMPMHSFRVDDSTLVVDLFVGPHLITPTTAAMHMLVITGPNRHRQLGRRPDAWYEAQKRIAEGGQAAYPDPSSTAPASVQQPPPISLVGQQLPAMAEAEPIIHFASGFSITMKDGIFEVPVRLLDSELPNADIDVPVTVEWRGQRFLTRANTWPWKQRSNRHTVANACMVLNIMCGRMLDAASPTRCMRDWVEWHRVLGVEHFFIYDNNSDDDSAFYRALKPYVSRGIVTLIDYPVSLGGSDPGGGPTQGFQIRHAQLAFMRRTQWLGFFDADEFVMPPQVLAGGDHRFAAAKILSALAGKHGEAEYIGVHSIMHNAEHPEYCEPKPPLRTGGGGGAGAGLGRGRGGPGGGGAGGARGRREHRHPVKAPNRTALIVNVLRFPFPSLVL